MTTPGSPTVPEKVVTVGGSVTLSPGGPSITIDAVGDVSLAPEVVYRMRANGADYPFALGEQNPLGLLDKVGFDLQTKNSITSANARRFLGVPEVPR